MTITNAPAAESIRYGIEIETTVPLRVLEQEGMRIGAYHAPVQVPFLPYGWKASRDGSIHYSNGSTGCEIVSPILMGADGLFQIQTVCRILKEKGFSVNASTGVHVSVDWGITDQKTIDRLISAVSFVEKGIYATTGTHGRESGLWCHSVHQFGDVRHANAQINNSCHGSRYHILNLTNLYNNQKRVEFRAFSGSLNPLKITGWVQLCIGIVQKAKSTDRIAKWSGSIDESHIAKRCGAGNYGAREFIRIQQFLRWQPALEAKKGAYGKIENAPYSFEAVQNELKKMVKKYDAETHTSIRIG